jgi:hypothetical protein
MGVWHGENAPTPMNLIQEIGSHIPDEFFSDPSRKYLDPYGRTGDFAVYLYDRLRKFHSHEHIVNNQLYILVNKKLFRKFLREKYGFTNTYVGDLTKPDKTINHILHMHFDAILTNPPFSKANAGKTSGKRSVNLYPRFYKMAIKLADVVSMIMPVSINKQMKEHNQLIKSTAHSIIDVSDDMQKQMKVIIKMWAVHYDKDKPANANIHFLSDKNEGNDIPFAKGKTNLSTIEWSDTKTNIHSKCVIKGLTRRGTEIKWCHPSDVKHTLPKNKYVVLLPLCIQEHGWSHIEIRKTNGEGINVNCYYILADTKRDAEIYLQKVTTPSFIRQAFHLKGNSNVMTIKSLKAIELE